ncbi:MAG: prepilin peptidase, partial [Verrucomicrobia bacterium]|nr:prepilin peptidase [Verrucomicrobiota bacterium]
MNNILDPEIWAQVPFHFWSVVFFIFGSMVGSFLNVCIYRMPRDISVVTPPSHCPQCDYKIPWYHNLPLFTWLILRGRCAQCRQSISPRYLAVEFLVGILFLSCWLLFGELSPSLALVYGMVLSGFVAATFIDIEHFIIPDEITLGGIGAGFLCSLAVPALHSTELRAEAMKSSFWGILIGGGVVYAIVRIGKWVFGRQRFDLGENTTIVFGEEGLSLPGQIIPYEEMFYRKTDVVIVPAKKAELIDRCFPNAEVRLSQDLLRIGQEEFDPENVPYLEVVTDQIVIPREAMGLGDVKFMGAIGAFLGWQATLFSLMFSSIAGALVGVGLIAIGKREWSSRLP